MKKALVTGANGFIGSAVVRELLSNHVEVVALARTGHTDKIPDGVKIVPFELSECENLPTIVADRDIDVFYHLAWEGSAGAKRADIELQLKNVQWTVECLRASKKMNCKRFVCAGSVMEHETLSAVYKQDSKPGLGYIYGSGKLAAHAICKSVASDIGIDLVWAEITNAYGIGELSPRFVNTTIRKIINDEPLEFTAGTQIYDFVYIDDVARAFWLIGKNGKSFRHYIIGSSNAKPLKDFVLEIKSAIASERNFKFGDVPFSGISLTYDDYDCSLTEKDTGFRAEIPFSEGVLRTMKWLKEIKNDTEI